MSAKEFADDTFKQIAEDAIRLLEAWDEQMWKGPGRRVRDGGLVSLDRRHKLLVKNAGGKLLVKDAGEQK